MAYRVEISGRAERDYAELFAAVHAKDSSAGARWHRGLKKAILSLENMPQRCPVAPESKRLRHLLYGRRPNIYRVIFRIVQRDRKIEVLHIRNGARDSFRMSELE